MAVLILRDGRWFNQEVPYQYVERINGYPIYVNSKWVHIEDVNPGFNFKCPDCGFKISDRWKMPYYERCPGCGNNMGQLLTDKDNFVDIGDIPVDES